jgi:hypothetical protein
VLAGGGRFLDHLGVGVGAGTYDDGLDVGVLHNDPVILGGSRDTKVGSAFLGCLQDDIGYGQQVGVGNAKGQVLGVEAPYAPRANKPNDLFRRHVFSPYLFRNQILKKASEKPGFLLTTGETSQ